MDDEPEMDDTERHPDAYPYGEPWGPDNPAPGSPWGRPQDRDPNTIMAAAQQKLRRQRLTVPVTPCAPATAPADGRPLTGTERRSDGTYAWVTYPCTCKDPGHAWTTETELLRQAWY